MQTQSNELPAFVFFTDIVSLSDRNLGSSESQTQKIEVLFNLIKKSKYFKESRKTPIVSLTGDGAAVCYRKSPRSPLELAIDLHRNLIKYNKNKSGKDKLRVRIGINTGLIRKTLGIGKQDNYWGSGLIIAQRIMTQCNPEHILMDSHTATELSYLSDRYKKIIHHVGEIQIKHGDIISIYSVYGKGFGNKTKPKLESKDREKEKDLGRLTIESLTIKEINDIANQIKHLSFQLIKPKTKQKTSKKTIKKKRVRKK